MYREEMKMNGARERDFKSLQEALADLARRIQLLDGDLGH